MSAVLSREMILDEVPMANPSLHVTLGPPWWKWDFIVGCSLSLHMSTTACLSGKPELWMLDVSNQLYSKVLRRCVRMESWCVLSLLPEAHIPPWPLPSEAGEASIWELSKAVISRACDSMHQRKCSRKAMLGGRSLWLSCLLSRVGSVSSMVPLMFVLTLGSQ